MAFDESPTIQLRAVPAQRPGPNVAAIVAIICAGLGVLLLPILLGPAAVVAGLVGHRAASRSGGRGSRWSLLAILVGIFEVLLVLDRLGTL